jgi:hypothetical protein
MACRPDADAVLALWERTLEQGAVPRDDALLRASEDGAGHAQTLGERNTRLLALHARLFGAGLALLSRCPACGTTAQFDADCDALVMQGTPSPPATPQLLESHGHRIEFRLPDRADIDAASAATSATAGHADFVGSLLERCVTSCSCNGVSVPALAMPPAVLDALSQRMDALDPAASLSFGVECPQCDARWEARLDVAQLVWQKVQTAAERVLLDVDALARAYGWTEPDVLRLSSVRRAAYLQMAGA